jgi:hypothetical protein
MPEGCGKSTPEQEGNLFSTICCLGGLALLISGFVWIPRVTYLADINEHLEPIQSGCRVAFWTLYSTRARLDCSVC